MSALRVLVDESLPRRFARELSELQASTVREEGWLGLRNGVLLRAAVDRGFTVLITADRSLEFQQNLAALGIAVVVLGGRNRLQDLRIALDYPRVAYHVTILLLDDGSGG